MNQFPNTRSMLPSEARAAITSHLIARLEASSLNIYGDPLYTYASALCELESDVDGYAWSVLDTCWYAARQLYDTRHPKHPTTRDFKAGHESTPGPYFYIREGIPVNG